MPKDTTMEDIPTGEPSKNVLSRGAACLYCRKRRIRCSATKPTCDHCKKLQRECVYDTGKPVSRVKQLEEKVAELEQLLGGGSGRGGSGEGQSQGLGSEPIYGISDHGRPPLSQEPSSSSESTPPFSFGIGSGSGSGSSGMGPSTQYSMSTQNSQPMDFSNMADVTDPAAAYNTNFLGFGAGLFSTFGTGGDHGDGGVGRGSGVGGAGGANGVGGGQGGFGNTATQPTPSAFPQFNALDLPIEDTFDFSMLDPNFMNLVNSFDNTLSAPPPPPSTSMPNNPFDMLQMQSQPPASNLAQNIPPGGAPAPSTYRSPDQIAIAMDLTNDPNRFHFFSAPQPGLFQGGPDAPPAPQPSTNESAYNMPMGNGNNVPSPAGYPHHPHHPQYPSQTFPSSSSHSQSHPGPALAPAPGTGSASGSTPSSSYSYSQPPQPQRSDSHNNHSYLAAAMLESAMGRFANSVDPQTNAIGLSKSLDEPIPDPNAAPKVKTRTFGLAMSSRDNGLDPDRVDPSFEGMPLVGGWFDAADLPTVARDHLLDIFFSGIKVVGQEIHIPRFLASLSLPPLRRPHPCLLYTMYLLASRASTHGPIRALESHFYSIALKQLDEAITHADRLLDAVRAATMLAVYKYGLAKYHEGYMMTGMAARMALSAGLHQIPSVVFKPSKYAYDRRADLGALMRQRAYILGPPVDAIDLGERIWAFWAVFTVDRCGAIASQWPIAIPDEIISTPFPKPLHEFELGLVSIHDDITVNANWLPSPLPVGPFGYDSGATNNYNTKSKSSMFTLYIRGLSILERASKLMYLPPEPEWDVGLATAGMSPEAGAGIGIDEFLTRQNVLSGGMGPPGGGSGAGGRGGGPGSGGRGGHSASTPGPGQAPPLSHFAETSNGTDESSRGWTKTPKIRTPKAYEQVRQALLRMERDLPEDRRTEWERPDDGLMANWHFAPGRKKEAVTLHFVIGCAWMFIFDVFSFKAENTLAVNVARRLTRTIRYVIQEDEYAEMDVFIAMVFSFLVKILIREVKRLHSIGDHTGAQPVEAEVETVVQALKRVGQRYNVASMQAMRADRYRKATESETDFLKTDEGSYN